MQVWHHDFRVSRGQIHGFIVFFQSTRAYPVLIPGKSLILDPPVYRLNLSSNKGLPGLDSIDLEHQIILTGFSCLQEMIYAKTHDNTLRKAAKQGTVEAVMEHESIQEKWKKIENQLSNEAAEREALAKAGQAASDGEDEPEEVVMRKAPNAFALHSPAYWRAVANATVRTYISLTPEPRTQEAVTTAIAQGNLKNIHGNPGESSVITLLDLELLGEAQGPGCQAGLRKQFSAPGPLLSRLLYGSMVARGAQKVNDEGEAKAVVEGDLLMVHCGTRGKKEIKAMFNGSKNQKAESDLKESIIVYTDESLRSRKKRVKGGYSGHTYLLTASSAPLAQVVPEKSYDFHTGSCWSDVFSGVQALGASELWYASRTI